MFSKTEQHCGELPTLMFVIKKTPMNITIKGKIQQS
jgi:hypothetical protein